MATASHRPRCQFGAGCYRKNPQHKAQFCHPTDVDWDSGSQPPAPAPVPPAAAAAAAGGAPPAKRARTAAAQGSVAVLASGSNLGNDSPPPQQSAGQPERPTTAQAGASMPPKKKSVKKAAPKVAAAPKKTISKKEVRARTRMAPSVLVISRSGRAGHPRDRRRRCCARTGEEGRAEAGRPEEEEEAGRSTRQIRQLYRVAFPGGQEGQSGGQKARGAMVPWGVPTRSRVRGGVGSSRRNCA